MPTSSIHKIILQPSLPAEYSPTVHPPGSTCGYEGKGGGGGNHSVGRPAPAEASAALTILRKDPFIALSRTLIASISFRISASRSSVPVPARPSFPDGSSATNTPGGPLAVYSPDDVPYLGPSPPVVFVPPGYNCCRAHGSSCP